ncbi:hypothetical protein BCR37DRAFT_380965 [Protomyces lactucae-debilis]|uniref:Uncharacterized protein n=1 Tax=Protomyces lactucae-debilis TaxID=2754530 RepID=A0A1Y2FA28_PROLT|nr:uncharacterized protein BCR37DRAFT_380965 [Protomyces lactucae-debilis]ORY80304.1 hypothetical protein BCR37DRAFT_380965 [Protomyces lactucae-debilis]
MSLQRARNLSVLHAQQAVARFAVRIYYTGTPAVAGYFIGPTGPMHSCKEAPFFKLCCNLQDS